MNNKYKYISRTDKTVSLSLEKKDTKVWGNFQSEQKRGTNSYLRKKINAGNDTNARKKASVEHIKVGLCGSHNNYNDDGICNNVNNGEIMEVKIVAKMITAILLM